MKKLIFPLLLILLFTACTQTPKADDNSSGVPESVTTPPSSSHETIDMPAVQGQLQEGIQFHRNWFGGYYNSQGYYYLDEIEGSDRLSNVVYADFSSGKSTVLCSKPECQHMDESCTGYVPFHGGASFLPTNNKLYHITNGNTEAEGVGGEGRARVDSLTLGGGERTNLVTLGDYEMIFARSYACDDAAVYFVVSDASDPEYRYKDFVLMALDVATGALTQLYAMSTDEALVSSYGETLVVQNIIMPNTADYFAPFEEWENEFTLVSKDGATSKSPLIIKNKDVVGEVLHDSFYGYEPATGNVVGYNLETGEKTVLGNISVPKEFLEIQVSVKLYTPHLFALEFVSFTESSMEYLVYGVDTRTNRVQEIQLPGGSYGSVVDILTEYDGKYFVIADTVETMGLMEYDGEMYETMVLQYRYAFITQEDYWNSNPNYQYVEQLG